MAFLFLWLAISVPVIAEPQLTDQQITAVADSVAWRKLLLYRTRLVGPSSSIATGSNFFLSPHGRKDAKAELLATLEAFRDPKKLIGVRLKQQAQCAFPARFKYLKKQLQLDIPDLECKDLNDWKKGIDAESVSLIFSTAYPNSPGSMFGHTLFRMNKRDNRRDLLSYGVGYAAFVPQGESSIRYALYGLFGGYDGFFTVVPYYLKVNEYNYSESRDIWEYDLRLTADQVDQLENLIWEVYVTADFRYYFIDENCAYMLLALLEAANPDLSLTSSYWGFVMPADSVKAVERAGIVSDQRMRPSLHKQMLAQVDRLTSAERNNYFDLYNGKRPVQDASRVELDAVLANLNYIKNRDGGKLPERQGKLFREALVRRSSMKSSEEFKPIFDTSNRPDLAHDSSSLDVDFAYKSDVRGLARINARWLLHDLLDDDEGYARFSQIQVLVPSVDVLDQGRIKLNKFIVADAMSLYPLEKIDPKPSWGANLRVDQFKDFGCTYCYGVMTDLQGGYGLNYFRDKAIAYAMLIANLEAGGSLMRGYRIGPGMSLATVMAPLKHYKLQLEARADYDIIDNFSRHFRFQFHFSNAFELNKSWALRADAHYYPSRYENVDSFYEIVGGLRYYY